jgi:hypothetical protein
MGKLLDAVRKKNGNLAPEQEAFVVAVEGALDEEVNTRVAALGTANTTAINSAIERVVGHLPEVDGKTSTIMDQLRQMGETMDKIEKRSTARLTSMEKYQLRKMLEGKKQEIIDAVRSSTPRVVEIEFNATRAATLMTTGNVLSGTPAPVTGSVEYDNEVLMLRYPQNFILDIIRSRQVARVPQTLVTKEQVSREGNATVVAEGGLKPLVSYKFEQKLTPREKIAAHMEFTEELENDMEQLFAAIVDLFERDLLRDWQDLLLAKIIATAPAYVSTSLDGTIPYPNIYNVIGAGILSIQQLDFEPTVIWMNPADVWAMNMTQDGTGQVIIPPVMVGSNQIAGLRVYTSNKIAQGKILIGDQETWKEQHTGFITRIGLINDQLIKNEKTIVGEVYSLLHQPESEEGSWIYLDIATVQEALSVTGA